MDDGSFLSGTRSRPSVRSIVIYLRTRDSMGSPSSSWWSIFFLDVVSSDLRLSVDLGSRGISLTRWQKKLDDVKIFSRGSNNARVLNPDMSREDVSSILFRAVETGEIRPLIRETENGFSHTPSMPALRSSSGFVTRPLSDFRVSAS